MKRIYYLTQTASLAREIFLSIEQAGISLKKFSVVSDDKKALKEYQLKAANLFQKRDVLRSLELGMLGGMLLGLVAALITVIIPPQGVEITPLLFSLEVFSLGVFGLTLGFLIGVSKDNFYIAEYRDQLDRNEFILLVDIEDDQYDKISHIMSTKFSHVIKLKEVPDNIPLLTEHVDRAA